MKNSPLGGYIRLYRKIRNNINLWPSWEKEKFTRLDAWLDLLLEASGIDRAVPYREVEIYLKRGQLIFSQRRFAERWGWTRKAVRCFIEGAHKRAQVRAHLGAHRITILTILNYNSYNPLSYDKGPTDIPTEGPTDRTTIKIKIKESKKKVKREDTKVSSRAEKWQSIDISLCNELANRILQNDPKSKVKSMTKKNQETWLIECRRLREIDERTPEEILAVIQFSQKDKFWRANILSMPTLREKFPQLWLKAKKQDQSGMREWVMKQEQKIKEEEEMF